MQKPLKIIFIGTAAIGASLLKSLSEDARFEIALVVTQIDKPAGRKMQLTASPIKQKAIDLDLSLFQPENINDEESITQLRSVGADMIVLMAYGQILKSSVLELPEFGCINIHASLLPKHRGASPIQQSLLHQDQTTGISVMQMVEKMDAGPVYKMFDVPITDDDNSTTLHDKLAELTAQKAPEVFYEIATADLSPTPQDHESATYCQKIRKTDGHIDWKESADVIAAKVRAFAGWPGTYTLWEGRRLKVLEAKTFELEVTEKPGTVLMQGNALLVACGRDALLLEEVQMEGKKAQSADEFVRGHSDFVGATLGS